VRQVRTIAYGQVVYLNITYAEYRAQCDCCNTFRSSPPGVDLKCQYDNQVRQAVLDRLLEDGMSLQRVLAALKRDFLLDLSEGFAYDCLHREVARLEMSEYRHWVLGQFSGTLCVDELHLGRYTLLLATDPLGDFPVAFALVGKNDQDHMRRFLKNLQNWGLSPEVVITDGPEPLSVAVGENLAAGTTSVVHFSRLARHQSACARCPQADAAGDVTTRQSRSPTSAWSPQQGSEETAAENAQGKIAFRVQASLLDREAA